MLLFRDHLRRNARDRRRYEAAKRELATRQWRDMNYYAAAKGPVITEILRTAGWTAPPNDRAEPQHESPWEWPNCLSTPPWKPQ
jgi:hypothetical protein